MAKKPRDRKKSKPPARKTTKRDATSPRKDRRAAAVTEAVSASPSRVTSSASTGIGGAAGPIVTVPRVGDHVGNIFETTRAGKPVVRPHDLLALRLELHNLVIEPGSPPQLRKTATGAAHLILHFPPQTITERTFFQTAQPGTAPDEPDPTDPGGNEDPSDPPIRARIAGESRIAFNVPDGFAVDYTLAGILTAIEELELAVPANARPPAPASGLISITDIFVADLSALTAMQRATLASSAVRSLRIAAVQSDAATLQLRQAHGGVGVRPLAVSVIDPSITTVPQPRPGPRPAAPTALQTALEIPWRLILSPHSGERWRHAKQPVISPAGRTELWHSRLVAPKSDGTPLIEPPRPDAQRTVRAVWALTGENSQKPMQSEFPISADLPDPSTLPFRMPLDDFDRFQISHLSSNFSISNYTPNPIGANLLMLSALGGWIDTRGAWDPPGLSVEEWVHRGTMGRDHYVKVVYKGFLYPFGHRVALIKVSERKFHNGAGVPQKSGNTAYLRQRLFIVVRERERRYMDTTLTNTPGTINLSRQFPFSSVRVLTHTTPNLDTPQSPASRIMDTTKNPPQPYGQKLFWPCVGTVPYEFQYVATDLDGRAIRFSLPAIFMDNTMASPRLVQGDTLVPDFVTAENNASIAKAAWNDATRADRPIAEIKQQRVALALSLKAGDTSVEADTIGFDAFVQQANMKLRAYSDDLSRPVWYPCVENAHVRIAALAQLTGSNKTNVVTWNAHYLHHGFTNNQGQVFVNVEQEANMAKLDFSSQGDRSGGFVQPNLKPSAISRLTGPVTGTVSNFISGTMNANDAFPESLSDLPLPLLFGCIPLGKVIEGVTDLADKPEQVPKFASEASTQVESFINGLVRLFDFVSRLAEQPGSLAEGAVTAFVSTLNDQLDQADAYSATLVANVKPRLDQLVTALNAVASQVHPLVDVAEIKDAPNLAGLAGALTGAQTAITNLRTAANTPVGGVSLPSGFRQSVLQAANQIEAFLADLNALTTLITQGKALFNALNDIVGDPNQLTDLLSDPDELGTRLDAVANAIAPIRTTLGSFRLLEGAPRKAVLDAIDVVLQVIANAADLAKVLEMLLGDELTIRFDWNPVISNWALPGADPATEALFRANDKKGFLVAVEAKVKKNGQSAPKISVVCSLKSFDLVLIAPASFIELNFEKIEFRVDSGAKMDVDVLLTDIKFVGPLSFVETLRDLIPLDGFSDPPFLDITPQGIDAGFSLALPNVSVGVFNLSNLSLGAGFTVPFIGQPVAVRFNFCTREQPFNLTVTLFGGGGFFGITLDPHGIQILEASIEFGASISIDFGVASGGVYVMAGLYFRMELDACSLTGYFRLGGHVSVLGLITASLELYLELRYEFESGKCVGMAKLTIEVEVLCFSTSVTITCEKKFAGSNGDPTFRHLMGIDASLPLSGELALIDDTTEYAWRDYVEAFAA